MPNHVGVVAHRSAQVDPTPKATHGSGVSSDVAKERGRSIVQKRAKPTPTKPAASGEPSPEYPFGRAESLEGASEVPQSHAPKLQDSDLNALMEAAPKIGASGPIWDRIGEVGTEIITSLPTPGAVVKHGRTIVRVGKAVKAGASEAREQIFKRLPTRKRALDARPRPKPVKPGQERVTRQSKNRIGTGNKGEKHRNGPRHVHDDRHTDPNAPNVHYGYPD
jgi:hypothetical protein